MLDTVIKNVRIVDGTGNASYVGAVGIQGDRLVTGLGGNEEASQCIDGTGKTLTPGFIDAHSHGDALLGTEDGRFFKTNQGITTEITGQCGLSMAPCSPEFLPDLKNSLCNILPSFPEETGDWTSFSRFMEYGDKCRLSANARMYVGHNSLRIAAMGMANRPATPSEMDRMKGLLREAMEAGAAGLSSGLIYTPSCYSDTEELVELSKVVAPFGGIYASHMRNESHHVVDAVKETVEIGRRSGASVCISHFKLQGRSCWGKTEEPLAVMAAAIDEGINLVCDQYPYTRCMTSLNTCVPPWHLAEGFDGLTKRLSDKAFRKKLQEEMSDPACPYENHYLDPGGWDGVYVTYSPNIPAAVGKTVAEYASELGQDPFEAFFDMMQANHCRTSGIFDTMSPDDLCEIIRAPFSVVGTDGLTRSTKEKGHPRATASFPHAINFYVKERKVLTLEQMIRKMTGLTAEKLGVKERGLIKDGYFADLVLMDYDSLRDCASYDEPNKACEGIEKVFVNGECVYGAQQFTGVYSGRVLRNAK